MLREYFSAFLELVFPGYCVVCQKQCQSFVCQNCASKLPWIKKHCLYCGWPTPLTMASCRDCRHRKLFFDQARSIFIYENEVKKLIHNFKYNDQKWLAPYLAFYLASLLKEETNSSLLLQKRNGFSAPFTAVTWVPMTNLKRLARGYNQSQLLAMHLAKIINCLALGLLVKKQNTLDQNQLKFKERAENLKGAFTLAPTVTHLPQAVILVDDVYTTGATVAECSYVLKRAGVKKIQVLTVARTV